MSRVRWPRPDFIVQPSRGRRAAWAFATTSMAVLGFAASQTVDLQRRLDAATAEALPSATTAPQARSVRPVNDDAEQRHAARDAQQLARQLGFRWDQAFVGAEQAAGDTVKWLAFDVQSERGTARLEGQAPTRQAVWQALDALSAMPGWSEVTLLRVDTNASSEGVRFELSAHLGLLAAARERT